MVCARQHVRISQIRICWTTINGLINNVFTTQVIADTTRRMGAGMAKYIQQDVESVADYDEYCHFVAGLVGAGLSQASLGYQLSSEVSPYICSRE